MILSPNALFVWFRSQLLMVQRLLGCCIYVSWRLGSWHESFNLMNGTANNFFLKSEYEVNYVVTYNYYKNKNKFSSLNDLLFYYCVLKINKSARVTNMIHLGPSRGVKWCPFPYYSPDMCLAQRLCLC